MLSARGVVLTVAAIAVSRVVAVAAATKNNQVAFPEGFRAWTHVKSMIIEPGHPLAGLVEGTHHIYANPKALAGYRQRPFADGAVIVFDLLETQRGERAVSEGPRKAVIVMRKDSKRYAATGGWGYEVFAAGDPTKPQIGASAAKNCHSCHMSQQSRDYVFSDYRP
jgi:hypothetical protein